VRDTTDMTSFISYEASCGRQTDPRLSCLVSHLQEVFISYIDKLFEVPNALKRKLFEAKFQEFSGQPFGGASRGISAGSLC
jgi:hypothetical protein